jgi:hypothetical protein
MRIRLEINWTVVMILSVCAIVVSAVASALLVVAPIIAGMVFMAAFGVYLQPNQLHANGGLPMLVTTAIIGFAAALGFYAGAYGWYSTPVAWLQAGSFGITCVVIWCRQLYKSGATA